VVLSLTGGITMLQKIITSLPPSEQKIAAYIIEHPEEAITATASELGERTSTSSAAVIRLCKSLGLKGFQDLKLRVAGDLQKSHVEGYRDIKPNESYFSIIDKMTSNSIQALRETSEIINTEELSKAVDIISAAPNIHFFGRGASGIVATDAQQKFLRINKNATALTDIYIIATQIANANPNDVVMAISFSGETEDIVKVLDMANAKGIKTISLTSYGISPVSERAMVKLFASSTKEAPFRSAATSSRLAQLHIIDILFMCLATQQYEQTVRYLDQTRELTKSLNMKFTPE
jgi:DNA-binding MurR/RpiR family transcriptional regulator